jgi:TMEM175 potassium channel family protein
VTDTFDTGRLEAFSDGVFAIAITLLVLEITVPASAFDDLWRGIVHEWPSYLAYATSFWTIGGLWFIHHGIFRRLDLANIGMLRLNLLLLMVVSFLPFPTKLMAEALREPEAETTAVLFYGATLLVITAVVAALGRYAARRPALLAEGVAGADMLAAIARAEPSLGFYGIVLVLALLAPQVAAFGFLVIAVLAVLGPVIPLRHARWRRTG